MFDPILTAEGILSLLTLTVMEIVLGIDNIVFISILTYRLEATDQKKARLIGISLAIIMRVFLLIMISHIIGFTKPLLTDFFGMDISTRDVILFGGGLFLIYKSTTEIHDKMEGIEEHHKNQKKLSLFSAVVQIILLDIVFSFDSILTAIGLVQNPERDVIIMIIAVVISMIIMLIFVRTIGDFINRHPTIKMLALSFLLMIGILLVTEAFHFHFPKGYIYFAMAFSIFVELLNMRMRKKGTPVHLHNTPTEELKDNEKRKSI